MNTMAVVAVATMLSFAVASPAYADSNKCANSFLGLAKQSCVEQVNLEDMRVKSGDVSGDTLTLNVKDQAKTQGRNYIYGKDVEIDVSGLNQADEVATNATHININTTNITDNRIDIDALNEQVFEVNANSTTNITDNRTDIDINRTDIDSQGDRITVNEGDITNNRTDIDINRTDIDINTTAISQVHEKANTNMQNIAAANQRIDNVMSDMRYMDRNLSAGIASAMAIGQHQFDPSYSGGQVSLAGGVFNGENAVSFAVGVPLGNNAFFSASIATDSGSYGESGAVGVTVRLPK